MAELVLRAAALEIVAQPMSIRTQGNRPCEKPLIVKPIDKRSGEPHHLNESYQTENLFEISNYSSGFAGLSLMRLGLSLNQKKVFLTLLH